LAICSRRTAISSEPDEALSAVACGFGLKKNWPVSEALSKGRCLPLVSLNTSLRTAIITSLMLAPSVSMWRRSAGEGTVAAGAVERDFAGLGGVDDHHACRGFDAGEPAPDI
jgi:hypothetical protein